MPRKGENVYHRKDGLWEARYVKEIDVFGKKKYASVYAKTCHEVKEKRQAMVDNILLFQKPLSIRNLTMSQLITEWLMVNQPRLKPSSYQRYKSFLNNHIEGFMGGQPAVYVNTSVIREFSVNRLEAGLKPQSVNALLVFLHSCMKYGHRQYNLPLPDIIYLPVQKKEMRVFSIEEQKRLVTYLKAELDVYKFGVLLALYTGLRIGELCALRWSDVEENRIKVRRTIQRLPREDQKGTELSIGPPKTNTSIRDIPIPSFLTELIEGFRIKSQGKEYVLCVPGKSLIEPRVMQYKFKKYLKDTNIKNAHFHTLRHTFATRCVECDFELKSLSSVLGHANIQVTLNRYVHASFELKASNMEKLQQIL